MRDFADNQTSGSHVCMFEVDQPDGSKLFELRTPDSRGAIQLMLVSPVALMYSDLSSIVEAAKNLAIDVASAICREALGVDVKIEAGPRVPLPKQSERN